MPRSHHPLRDLALVAAGAAVGAGLFGAASSAAQEAGYEPAPITSPDTVGALDRAVVSTLNQRLADQHTILTVNQLLGDYTPPRTAWDTLADCESGDWDADSRPIPGTARWDYGLSFDHGDIYEGGLNFHPGTWDEFRDAGMADHAGEASRAEQIVVAERVLEAQGWGAWPVCSRKVGLR